MFVNSTGRLQFDIGLENPDELIIYVPEAGAELFVFRGQPAEVSRAYTGIVGRPRYAPDWIFRLWISRNSFLGAYEIDRVVQRMAKLGMPVGVVVLEAWEEELHNFRFTTHRYPNPKEWIARLKEQGVRVVCWMTSSMWTGTEVYRQAKERGYLVLNEDGSEHVVRWLENGRKLDFRKPEVRDWWKELHKPLIEMGVDGFKTDGGEHMPDPFFHNLHTYYYQKATLDAFTELGREGVTFARSASSPNAGLGTYWAGDQHAEWSRLKGLIRGGLSTALSGFPLWAHDIGAYTGTPTKDLYLRWLQFGVFSPIMQFHGINAREPWHFDKETLEIAQFYFRVREKLRPHLIEWARETISEGNPIIRPLIWYFPDDVEARQNDSQYMFGPDLLVAPVTDPVHARGVYLPAGEWIDLWTGAKTNGPTRFLREAELHVIPVYVRAAAYETYRGLFDGAPAKDTSPIAITLAGPSNDRGIIPVLRYWKPGSEPERVYYELSNRLARAATFTVSLEADAGLEITPAAPFTLTMQPGDVQRLAFSIRPSDNLAPSTYPIRLQLKSGPRILSAPPVGMIITPRWQALGLFEGGVGSGQSLDGQPVDLQASYSGRHAHDIRWREVPLDLLQPDGGINLESITGPAGSSTTYLYAEIASDRVRTVRLLTGFGDAMTIWMNGKQIASLTGHRNAERDEDAVEATLVPGVNRLVIRNSRDLATPLFYFRIVW